MSRLAALQGTFAQAGKVRWIGLRRQRRATLESVVEITLCPENGLVGDHYAGRSGKRHVTLIDAAHLKAIASYLDRDSVAPETVRRNIVISGLNLRALKGQRFRLGAALLEYTGECHPCSRMEEVLGPGGYNAVRGHGGICARVVEPGLVKRGDALVAVDLL